MKWLCLLMVSMLTFAAFALAEIGPIPEMDPVVLVMKLASEWKVLGPIGAGILIVMLITQAVKALVPEDFKYKRLLALILAMVYMVLVAISSGLGIGAAILGVLLTSGGAMALYEALKGVGVIKKA